MGYIKTDDCYNIWFEQKGTGIPIVWVHEFGGDHRSWYQQISEFKNHYLCITYAARGFYPSDIPQELMAYGQARASQDLVNLMDALEIESAHIVGTSMGSFTSLDFTLGHTERVRTLTLVGNSSGPRTEPERQQYRHDWLEPEISYRSNYGSDGAVAILQKDPAYQTFQKSLPNTWQTYAENLRSQPVSGAIKILKTLHWNRHSWWNDEERLRQLQLPLLLLYGDEDYYLVGETNEYLNTVLPRSTLKNFSNTGHLVNIEQAFEFNQLLARHIEQFECGV